MKLEVWYRISGERVLVSVGWLKTLVVDSVGDGRHMDE